MPNMFTRLFIFLLFGAAFAGFVSCAKQTSLATLHPFAGQICSDCHNDWRATLDHTTEFNKRHKFLAAQQNQVCGLCHVQSFCADCHAYEEELKPSDKFKDEPQRSMPHRGDYLAQHRIDGKIDPASCFPCHGRRNNERCRVCHK